ncbi:phosphocarrier protein [Rhizobiales bacterium GAS191]|jgi:phosphocarrier protein HPr|nr:phosphocarrier protein [Rhizobiales bacterium GAS188]SEE55624.1 phosphocarrier protein [Rhizobiales bacterium GAS191]
MDDTTATSSVPLTNSIGLHARPSVKLTKLAKTFAAHIEVAPTANGPWVDAKSIVKVMAVKAAKGAVLHFRATGHDAGAALAALRELVALDFHEDKADHDGGGAGPTHG